MVVDDDDVDPCRAQRRDGSDGARAAVASHDDGRAGGLCRLDASRRQIVPVDQPPWNERHGAGAKRFEGANENRRRRHSVDVIVAMNENRLAGPSGWSKAVDGDIEVQEAAVLEMIQTGTQIPLGCVAGDVPPRRQQATGHLGQAELFAQRGDYIGLWRVRNKPPGSGPGGNIARGHIRKLETRDAAYKQPSPA